MNATKTKVKVIAKVIKPNKVAKKWIIIEADHTIGERQSQQINLLEPRISLKASKALYMSKGIIHLVCLQNSEKLKFFTP